MSEITINRITDAGYKGTDYSVKEAVRDGAVSSRFVDFSAHHVGEINIEAHELGEKDERNQVISITAESTDWRGDKVYVNITLFSETNGDVDVRSNIPRINRAKSYNSTICEGPSRKLSSFSAKQ